MAINNIITQGVSSVQPSVSSKKTTAAPGGEFMDIIKNSIDSVNKDLQAADKASTSLISGQSSNIHETMIAMEKANVSFRLLTKVQSKVISAYQEVMRTQL